jgi:hypothetical protein
MIKVWLFLCDSVGKLCVMGDSVCYILFLFGFIGISVIQNFVKSAKLSVRWMQFMYSHVQDVA